MNAVIQLGVAGLAIGMIYALVALGFVLIFNAVNVVNFAQGDFAMFPAFVVSFLLTSSGLPMPLAIAGTLLFAVVFGLLFNRLVYYPLRKRSFVPVIIATIGVSVFLKNIALVLFGADPRKVEPLVHGVTRIFGPTVNAQYLVIIGVTVVLLVLQYLLFDKTMLGKRLQATAQNREMASLLGINTHVMIAATFAYSALLGAVAGILVAPLFGVTTELGTLIALKAFAATVIGGFGSVPGAVVGAVFLGLIEIFGAAYVSSDYKDAFAFVILIAVLLLRPQGFFGERVGQHA
jgi:branched-chain amino acid transport system permease protein